MGNPFKALARAFGWIGSHLAIVLHMVAKLVTDEQVDVAMVFVQRAATNFATGAERRKWVSGELQARFRISESLANLLVELAVQAVKKQIQKGVNKLDDILSDDDEPQAVPAGGYPPGA